MTGPALELAVDLSKAAHGKVPVVWGGPHATLLAEQCLKEPYIDFVVKGEGEEAIIDVLEHINNNGESKKIFEKVVTDLDKYKPAWHLIKNLNNLLFTEKHSVRGKDPDEKIYKKVFYYIVTSRGCPYRCRFCYNTSRRFKWRGHSLEWVEEQIKYIKEVVNPDAIGLWDDNMWVDQKRALAIINLLKKYDLAFLCEVRADRVTEDLIKLLKDANCLQIFIGAESGSQRVLDYIKKDLKLEQLRKVVEWSDKYHLPARFSFIIGFPEETQPEVEETIQFIIELSKHQHVSISGPKAYTPYPGTSLYEEAIKYGFKVPESVLDWKNITRYTNPLLLPWFREENIKYLKMFG